jgi:probable F420-dependent oxidoreductase
MMTLRIGLSVYDISASELVQVAVAADDAGFESLWLGEHIVLPTDYGSEHPTTGDTAHQHHTGPIVDPSTVLLDPLVALAACATVTTHLRLATGIFILPLRHPLLTARMTLTLQDVAGGRFMLGVGSGWLEEEFDALDVPFENRAIRMDETLAILRQAWRGDRFSHDGPLFEFGNVQLSPRAVDVPLILGGNTERALRRAATAGDGWFSSGTPSLDDAIRLRDRVTELRDASGAGGAFSIFVRIAKPDRALLASYEAEGFEHALIWADQLWPTEGELDDKRTAFAAAAAELGVEPRRVSTES